MPKTSSKFFNEIYDDVYSIFDVQGQKSLLRSTYINSSIFATTSWSM